MIRLRYKKGSIALTTVLMVSAILLASGLTLILTSIDLSFASKNFNSYQLSKIRSKTCLEESLYKISKNPSYTGTVSYTYSDGSCTAIITNDLVISTTKIVSINTTLNVYNYSETKRVDTTK